MGFSVPVAVTTWLILPRVTFAIRYCKPSSVPFMRTLPMLSEATTIISSSRIRVRDLRFFFISLFRGGGGWRDGRDGRSRLRAHGVEIEHADCAHQIDA